MDRVARDRVATHLVGPARWAAGPADAGHGGADYFVPEAAGGGVVALSESSHSILQVGKFVCRAASQQRRAAATARWWNGLVHAAVRLMSLRSGLAPAGILATAIGEPQNLPALATGSDDGPLTISRWILGNAAAR